MAQAAPLLFPMYTVAADVLLKMTKVEPHEDLKAGGKFGNESLVREHVWFGCFFMSVVAW